MRRRNGIVLTFCALMALASGAYAASGGVTYYLHPAGDDANTGRTPAKPWKTLERASRQGYKPGDRILLAGGKIFPGNLILHAKDAGTSDSPVIIGSYGTGRATIQAGLGYGVLVQNAGGVEVRDLICIGEDRTRNHGCGVAFVNTLPGNIRLKHIRLRNIEARGFGRELPKPGTPEGTQSAQGAGILVGGFAIDHSKSGYEDVEIRRCDCHDNAYYGILTTGSWDERATRYANANVHISDCRFYRNTGDPLYRDNHSGSGILVEDCDGGLVERCVAYENGALCNAGSGGPCGIWTAVANRVVIQHCEAYNNHTGMAPDGDGFDLDGGCTQCVLQYNYSHGNDGAGILVYTYRGAPHTDHDNVVRYNICENDSVKGRSYGAINVGNDGKGMTGVRIYQNTFLTDQPAEGVVNVHGQDVEVAFYNNILVSNGAAPLVHIDTETPMIVLQGNLYWRQGGGFARLGAQEISDLGGWRAAGKETLVGKPVGLFADPDLNLNATRGKSGDLSRLKSIRAFSLRPGSPALKAGLDLQRLFGIDPGPIDFRGYRRPTAGADAIGACVPSL